MNHVFYVTINQVNGKRYYGKHSTKNLDDGYLGSGTLLHLAIKKYGMGNFKRYDLAFFDSEELAYEFEELAIDEFLINEHTYNVSGGGVGAGYGPCNPAYGTKVDENRKQRQKESLNAFHSSNPNYMKEQCAKRGDSWANSVRASMKTRVFSEEVKNNIRAANSREFTFHLNGAIVIIKNLAEYCKEHNLSEACMRHVYAGRNKSHRGYTK